MNVKREYTGDHTRSSPVGYPEGPTSPLTPLDQLSVDDSSQRPTPSLPDRMDTELSAAKTLTSNANKFLNGTGANNSEIRNIPPSNTNTGTFSRGGTVPDSSTIQVYRKASSMGYDLLGEEMRDMVTTINQLRTKGVEDLGLPLPRIAVIGNQSAGKSSLIEAISGIRVPRFAGTCTRCPLEITLTEDPSPLAPWNCQISLRFHKKYVKRKNSKGDPWEETAHQQFNFMIVRDPEDVETALIKAQLAILNPSRPWGEFVDIPVTYTGPALAGTETTEVPFSPNVICMEITGYNVPNLSFIDLPGIIHVTEKKEEEYLIKLVKNLVESYIKQEDCLILLAMTMKDDAVNQSAAQMARKLGPNRTIGALTKPDTVLEGEHEQWIKILRGREHRLHHGYFVTKQPSQQQLLERISHEQARKHEDIFFNNMEPWKTELANINDRFGTVNLQKYLSKQLAGLIRMRLPTIIESVDNQMAQVQAQLDLLPPPPASSLRLVLRDLLENYFYQIRDTIDARSDNNEFSYQWRKIAKQLKSGLIALRPRVNPDETSSRSANSPYSAVARANHAGQTSFGSFSSSSTTSTPSKGRKRPASSVDPPDEASSDTYTNSNPAGPARKKVATNDPRTPVKKVISLEDDEIVETESATDSAPENGSKPMHLNEIREVLEINMTAGIPQIVDHKAVEILSKMHLRMWDTPIQLFISQIDDLLRNHVLGTMGKVFARYENSPIYAEMTNIVESFHESIMTKIRKCVRKCFEIEAECVYTQQEIEWTKELSYWRQVNDSRRRKAVEEQKLLKQQRLQERLNASGKKSKIELPDREGPDPFQREIETMTNTQAYLAIARKRFGDTLMMRMIRTVFVKYTTLGTFREWVEAGLDVRDMTEEEKERKCRELMVEDPGKERRRNELMMQLDVLAQAKQDLEPFQRMGLL
ncbi:Dynamin [Arthrobotrys entomopaga]|nr:Dynamin [Arthrobotrys entomopaga]